MRKIKLTKVITSTLVIASVLALIPIGASAEWRQDSNGWWYTEGSSWVTGEKRIEGHDYYFEPNGYMTTGWRSIKGKWKYFDNNGCQKTGWIQSGGQLYYINSLGGYMDTNQYVDGWYLNNDGVGTKCINIGKFEIDKSTGTIIKFSGSDTSLVIPKVIDGIEIKRINTNTFYNCKDLTSVTIPNNVTYISTSAFDGCTNLTSIIVDDNNKNYTSVDGVLLNKTKTELLKCPEGKVDKNYVIPDSVITISWYALEHCYSLASITIPDSIKNIGKNAFEKESNTIFYVNSEEMKQSLIIDGIDKNKIILNSQSEALTK